MLSKNNLREITIVSENFLTVIVQIIEMLSINTEIMRPIKKLLSAIKILNYKHVVIK